MVLPVPVERYNHPLRVAWWRFQHALCWATMVSLYRFRAWGTHHIPATGPVLLVSNHQSYLDPVIVGLGAYRRRFYALARKTLFRNPLFGWHIRLLNAIPVDQDETDIRSMRSCLEVLKAGHPLLIFPEGARTPDGRTHPFATGTMLLIRRTRPAVVPVAIEGAYDIWPRGGRPKLTGRLGVMYGPPIDPEELIAQGADAALERLCTTVESMRLEVAERLRK